MKQSIRSVQLENIKGGFHIIANVLDVQVKLPVELGPTLRIVKADADQVNTIHQMFARMSAGFTNPRMYYENRWTEAPQSATSKRFESAPLAPDDWRYYILAFAGFANEAYDFLRAANLATPAINSFAHIYTDREFGVGNTTGWGGDALQSVAAYEVPYAQSQDCLDEAAILDIREAYASLKRLEINIHSGIDRATNVLQSLKRISRGTDLRILGLFAILEMLLTHNPNNKEIGDSLSHQISTKIPLLSARFSVPIDYGPFGINVSASTAWKKLYEYRSRIAHGESIEFDGGLQLIRDRQTASDFLEEATRKVVRHALNEPVLVDALKPI
jgi:Apea-like HEPN